MSLFRKLNRWFSIFAATLLLISFSAIVSAQGALEEVVVTAQKREQGLQEVPIAVTAIDSEGLKAAGIENILDLQFNTPNLMLNRNSNYTIRGVGTTVFGSSRDAGVGIAVDSVFVQSPVATAEMYDLARVEVLRGPQGTLFGRNTTGGLVNFVTHKAEPDFGASLEIQIENPKGVRSTGMINFPISDTIYQRFAFNYVKRDGYTKNLFTGDRIDGRDQYALRSSTHFEFGDNTSADLVVNYYKEDSNRNNSPKALCTPHPQFICSPDTVSTNYPTVNYPIDNALLGGVVRANRFLPNPDSLREVRIDFEPKYEAEEVIASFELTHSFGDLDFTSVTGYYTRELYSERDFDLGAAPAGFNPGSFNTAFGPVTLANDGSGNGILSYLVAGRPVTTTSYSTTQTAFNDAEQWSQEFRLASNYDGAFNFLVGVYYLDFDIASEVVTYIPAGRTFGGVFSGTPSSPLKSTAVFGEAYWDITDSLQLTAGLRWTKEKKSFRNRQYSFFENQDFRENSNSFSETTGRLVLNWAPVLDWSDSSTFYASISRGYKSGGFNPGNEVGPTYDSEFVTAYEIGSKNILADNSLQLNGALFYYDYENLTLGNLVGTSISNTNVPSSEVRGAELELVAVPNESFRFEAAAGLLKSEIKSDFNPPDPSRGSQRFQLKGNSLPNGPEATLKLAAQYFVDLESGWSVSPRVDWYWQDSFFAREFNTGADKVDSWQQLDFQVNITQINGPWRVKLFVKNATDNDDITHLETNSSLVGSFKNIFLLDPRTYGIAVEYRIGEN